MELRRKRSRKLLKSLFELQVSGLIGRRKLTGIGLTLGAIVLTYVELQLQSAAPPLYPLMFGAVFVVNTVLAIDGYNEAKMTQSA